jgi:hypothetical protein
MDLGWPAVLLTALAGTGLWSVLRLIVQGHNERKLEREVRESCTKALEGMPPAVGFWFFERDRGGSFRAIHLPGSLVRMLRHDPVVEEGGDGTLR